MHNFTMNERSKFETYYETKYVHKMFRFCHVHGPTRSYYQLEKLRNIVFYAIQLVYLQ